MRHRNIVFQWPLDFVPISYQSRLTLVENLTIVLSSKTDPAAALAAELV